MTLELLLKHSKNKTPVLESFVPSFGCETETEAAIFSLFFKIHLRSTTSLKWSQRELFIDVAEHRIIVKKKLPV